MRAHSIQQMPPRRSTRRRIGGKEARNEACSALVQLPAPVQLLVLTHLSVVQLWWARGISQHFNRQAMEVLQGLPRLVSVGGSFWQGPGALATGPEVEVLSLATMRWSAGPRMATTASLPLPLPAPRGLHMVAAFGAGGRTTIVAAGGLNVCTTAGGDPMRELQKQVVQWVPGSAAWASLPDMQVDRSRGAAVALGDGRLLVAGGWDEYGFTLDEEDEYVTRAAATVEVLAADGSSWAAAAAMSIPRADAAAGLLASGRVIIAGGVGSDVDETPMATVEQWDPVEDKWSLLPPMATARYGAAGCVLEDGRFAVLGGTDGDHIVRRDGEVFDPVAGTWQVLPDMTIGRATYSVVAVAGGMVAIGGHVDKSGGGPGGGVEADGGGAEAAAAELFDTQSGRWIALQHTMAVPRDAIARVVSVPADAFAPPAPPAVVAAAGSP